MFWLHAHWVAEFTCPPSAAVRSRVRTFGGFAMSPSSLGANVNYIHFSSRDFSRKELTAPERQENTGGYMPGRKGWVDGVSPTLQLSHFWRMQTFLHKGVLWLEGRAEAAGPPRWLPGEQGNTLFVKEVDCPDGWGAKQDAHLGVHGERLKPNLASRKYNSFMKRPMVS